MARGVGGHSPSNIARFLRGIDFPADRQEILDQARSNGAPGEVLDVLEHIPERDYGNMAELMKGVGEVE